jgi:hypothetical protein
VDDPFETEHRSLYVEALDALCRSGVPFMVGGAFAVWHYTGLWRDTHDIDIYMTRDHVAEAAKALDSVGFIDLGEQAAGDRQWIYHSGRSGLIIDVIWRFANLANYVTPDWFERASAGELAGLGLRFLPPEELTWTKVFVINRHRCDWPDVMRLAQAQCQRLDWDRLLGLLGEHWLLLAGLIDVFDWQYPESMGCIPDGVRDELARRRAEYRRQPPAHMSREHLLDPWLHVRADGYAIRRDE